MSPVSVRLKYESPASVRALVPHWLKVMVLLVPLVTRGASCVFRAVLFGMAAVDLRCPDVDVGFGVRILRLRSRSQSHPRPWPLGLATLGMHTTRQGKKARRRR